MRSMRIYLSERVMYKLFRFSDPDNDGLIDTLELQFLLHLSKLLPKEDDVTLADLFYMEDDRDGQHVRRVDAQSGYIIGRLFDPALDETMVRCPLSMRDVNSCVTWDCAQFRAKWDMEDSKRPREHTLEYARFRKVFIETTDIVKVMTEFGIEVSLSGGRKKVRQKNVERLTEFLINGDEEREALTQKVITLKKGAVGPGCDAFVVGRHTRKQSKHDVPTGCRWTKDGGRREQQKRKHVVYKDSNKLRIIAGT